jgi:hypothetical protein
MALVSLVLAIERGDVELCRLLRFMRMGGTGIDLEVGHQAALKGTAGKHALDGLEDDALGKLALDDLARGAGLETAWVTRMPLVKTTFSALTTMTLSPMSTCGV